MQQVKSIGTKGRASNKTEGTRRTKGKGHQGERVGEGKDTDEGREARVEAK